MFIRKITRLFEQFVSPIWGLKINLQPQNFVMLKKKYL